MNDDIDWNQRPYVTQCDLIEMRPYQRAWFLNQPNIWRNLRPELDVLYNCAHPDNKRMWMDELVREAVAHA